MFWKKKIPSFPASVEIVGTEARSLAKLDSRTSARTDAYTNPEQTAGVPWACPQLFLTSSQLAGTSATRWSPTIAHLCLPWCMAVSQNNKDDLGLGYGSRKDGLHILNLEQHEHLGFHITPNTLEQLCLLQMLPNFKPPRSGKS